MKDKRSALEAALQGSIGAHQRFVLKQLLGSADHFDALIAEVDAEVQRRIQADVDSPSDARRAALLGSEAVAHFGHHPRCRGTGVWPR